MIYMNGCGVYRGGNMTKKTHDAEGCRREERCAPSSELCIFLLSLCLYLGILEKGVLVLYSRGRPTSLVLLLRVKVSEFSLPLRCHPPLRLHHLLRLAGASRGHVALAGVEALDVRRRVASGGIEVGAMATATGHADGPTGV